MENIILKCTTNTRMLETILNNYFELVVAIYSQLQTTIRPCRCDDDDALIIRLNTLSFFLIFYNLYIYK